MLLLHAHARGLRGAVVEGRNLALEAGQPTDPPVVFIPSVTVVTFLGTSHTSASRTVCSVVSQMDEASQDNAELRKRLAGSAGENAGGPSACPEDPKGFLYPVELGSGSSDRENSPAWYVRIARKLALEAECLPHS